MPECGELPAVLISGGVHGKYTIPVTGRLAPYGLLGLGFYRLEEDYQETEVLSGTTTVYTDESEGLEASTRFGGKVGAGAAYQVSPKLGIGLQAEYHVVTLDAPPGASSTYQFFGVRAGLSYYILRY